MTRWVSSSSSSSSLQSGIAYAGPASTSFWVGRLWMNLRRFIGRRLLRGWELSSAYAGPAGTSFWVGRLGRTHILALLFPNVRTVLVTKDNRNSNIPSQDYGRKINQSQWLWFGFLVHGIVGNLQKETMKSKKNRWQGEYHHHHDHHDDHHYHLLDHISY